ncbi:MAG: ATP-binding protein [Bacteroidota bacterium]
MEQSLHAELKRAQEKIARLESQLAVQRNHFQILIQHAPVSLALFDTEMNYLAASQKYRRNYGLVDQDIVGQNHYSLFPTVPKRWRESHQRCLKGVTESCMEDKVILNGHEDYVDWVVTPWYKETDEVGGLILMAELVTERVMDKEHLAKLNRDLRHANERLERFAFAISNNLREPIDSCLGVIDIINAHVQVRHWQEVPKNLQYLLATSQRLQSMLNGLLDHAIHPNEGQPTSISLNQVVDAVLENLKLPVERRQAHIVRHDLPDITANEFEMMALFQNLIANGIKHNDSHQPEVSISAHPASDYWQFEVQDNGRGIALENINDLFNPFHYQDGEHVGIGLPLCRRIILDLGGQFWINSEVGKGTIVMFSLPRG